MSGKKLGQRLSIPDTDLSLSPLGLGLVKAGLTYEGEEADRMIGTYLERGGNLLDTARVYSDWIPGEVGRSERVVGESLERLGRRDSFVLMTKGGHPRLETMHTPRMSREEMRGDLERSLRALRCGYIDIYVYHRDDESRPVEEEIETMEEFRREGKIRYYACSNWSAGRMRQADAYAARMGYRGFIGDQSLCNLGIRYMAPPKDDTLTVARGEIFTYHARSPRNLLMPFSGAAEGYFHHLLQGRDVRSSAYDTEKNRALAGLFERLGRKYGATPSQVLFGFFAFLVF